MDPGLRRGDKEMRKKRVYKKFRKPDTNYERIDLSRFINYVMQDGKKSIAEKVVYNALDRVKETTKSDPILVFDKAILNVSPLLEVVSRRVGGANYQIPQANGGQTRGRIDISFQKRRRCNQ